MIQDMRRYPPALFLLSGVLLWPACKAAVPPTGEPPGGLEEQALPQSPEIPPQGADEIIPQIPPAIHRRGKIVHGETGEPIGGAFVFGTVARTQEANLAEVTDAEWEKLRGLPANPDPEEPALQAIFNHYSASGVTRSADDGSFDLVGVPGESVYSIMAADKDFIPVSFTLNGGRANLCQDVDVGELKLHPAAKVRLKLAAGPGSGGANAHWILEPGSGPCWAGELDDYGGIKLKIERGVRQPFIVKGSPTHYEYANSFISWEKPTRVFVPAGCALRLKLTWPYNDAVSPLEIPTLIRLGQGETLDLGTPQVVATVPVELLVTDESGQPVEGIPVRAMINGECCWTVAQNTNWMGKVWFRIPPGRPSKLGIIDFGLATPPANVNELQVVVEATGKEKPAPVFRLTISSDAIRRVVRQAPAKFRLNQ